MRKNEAKHMCTFYQSYVCSRIVEYIHVKHREKKFKKSKKQNDHLFYIFLCDTNYLDLLYTIYVFNYANLCTFTLTCVLCIRISHLSLSQKKFLPFQIKIIFVLFVQLSYFLNSIHDTSSTSQLLFSTIYLHPF